MLTFIYFVINVLSCSFTECIIMLESDALHSSKQLGLPLPVQSNSTAWLYLSVLSAFWILISWQVSDGWCSSRKPTRMQGTQHSSCETEAARGHVHVRNLSLSPPARYSQIWRVAFSENTWTSFWLVPEMLCCAALGDSHMTWRMCGTGK